MTEFKAGEHTTKSGIKAVVIFEISNPIPINEYVLGGYIIRPDGTEVIVRWTKSGESSWGSEYDLMSTAPKRVAREIFLRKCDDVNEIIDNIRTSEWATLAIAGNTKKYKLILEEEIEE
jgi:hypothetical protein